MTAKTQNKVKKTRTNRVGDVTSMKVFGSKMSRLVKKTSQLELASLKEKGIIQ
ncbi:hypothetical protein ACEUKD_08705 [Vibrio diabolicus]|jgi:hypothetical protein|uniref:hypothetical protein n=1 Tax=Vibrio harveyi group TaxID=717610 RepID=UPI00040D5885|nr:MULTISPECIES: hypothetical protein [Vibrio harveyi group]MBE4476337.1 hypothetical protein [Vibrio parahaemolyticus]MCS0225707.1 hypothetical protein [Vibrio alginolyticus]MCX8860179.1 hypothetical protein [Vibrio parahaemolyticus]MCX8865329.1 hypothetical protein [Vibrio parahaemolyticus]MCX8870411.1 hypothetical protein [Vibrio parahaemolyticus]